MARYSGETLPTVFSDDAAFTDPQFHEFLEAHDFFIAIHPSSHAVIEARVVDLGAPGLREKLIKIAAMVVRNFKYVTFQMGEVAVSRKLFAAILERIQWFGVSPPLVQRV